MGQHLQRGAPDLDSTNAPIFPPPPTCAGPPPLDATDLGADVHKTIPTIAKPVSFFISNSEHLFFSYNQQGSTWTSPTRSPRFNPALTFDRPAS